MSKDCSELRDNTAPESNSLSKFNKKRIFYNIFLFGFIAFLFIPYPVNGSIYETEQTSTLLTVITSQSNQQYPGIYGEKVFWVDSSLDKTVHCYDIFSGEETLLNHSYTPADSFIPSIFQNYLSFVNMTDNGCQVILHDLSTDEEFWVGGGNETNAWDQDLGEGTIVWSDNRNGSFDIYLFYISNHTEILLSSDTADTDESNPKISGNYVVWQSVNPETYMNDIYLYSLLSGTTTLITPGTEYLEEKNPAIDGDYIVFQGMNPETWFYDIFIYNISSGDTLLLTPGTDECDEEEPAINDGKVVWIGQDPDDFSYALYLYDINTGITRILKRENGETKPSLPAIFQERIVWQQPDPDTGYFDIYMSTLGIDAPPLIANFTNDLFIGGVPLQVNFTDLSQGEPSGWHWDFGDGTTSREQNPSHIYTMPGVYDVSLIVHTPYQRSGVRNPACIYAGTPPTPDFSFDRADGLAPLTVHFTDESTGSPETYLWDFGDGSTSDEKDPSHTYLFPGTYRVSLTTGNEFGNATSSVEGCIVVPFGVRNDLLLNIPGITCRDGLFPCELTLNSSLVEINVINNTSIEVLPDQGTGIGKILFIADEGFSLRDQFSIMGTLSRVDISSIPLFYGDDNSTLTYLLRMEDYRVNGSFHAEVWENATPLDYEKFKAISNLEYYSGICGVALTARFTQCNLSSCQNGTLIFGLNPEWIEMYGWRRPVPVTTDPDGAQVYIDGEFVGVTPLFLPDNLPAGNHTLTIYRSGYQEELRNVTLEEKRESIRVIRIADDGSYEILPVSFLFHDEIRNLDYFSTESPHGFSTFGVVSASHAGSPIQIFYLILSKLFSSAGTSSSTSSSQAIKTSDSIGSPAPAPMVIPPERSPSEQIPTVIETPPYGTPPTVTTLPTSPLSSPTETPGADQIPKNPEAVFPSVIGYSFVRNVAIVFGIVLVAAILVLRWRKGGTGP
ncbi:MAG TPA: PKD domain-containing protein [Methanolinea sp.]|nr:PKD domain-containing protein [Methanolinea sp.]